VKLTGILKPAAVAALLISAPAWAGDQLRDYGIRPTSSDSVVFFKADRLPSADYELMLQQEGHRNIITGGPTISVSYRESSPYVGRRLKPGTYILTMVAQQKHWGTCFTDTVSFSVGTGKVYYLGAFNSLPVLEELQQNALSRGKGRLSGGTNAIGWEHKVQPRFDLSSTADFEAARQWVTTTMPQTTTPAEALSTIPHSRQNSGGAKTMQICG